MSFSYFFHYCSGKSKKKTLFILKDSEFRDRFNAFKILRLYRIWFYRWRHVIFQCCL